MSDTTARLDAIQARLDAAAPGAITITPSDIAWLMDVARKQQTSIDAVRDAAWRLSNAIPHDSENPSYASGRTSGFRIAAAHIREALDAKP